MEDRIRSHIRCSHMEWQCLSFENSVEHKEIKYDRRAKKEALLSYFV